MNMVTKLNIKNGLAVVIFTVALLSSYAIFVHAQGVPDGRDGEMSPNSPDANVAVNEGAAAGITFPVAELGGCNSKDECKSYCNDSAHMEACIAFAEAHGLMNKEDASRATKFKETLQTGGGPGGCTNPRDCKAYCSAVANIEACVKFAKEQGINDPNVAQGERILTYTKSGGQMPGNCTSRESCDKYCSDFSHGEECYAFSKKAGIIRDLPEGEGPKGNDEQTPEQFQKLSELMKSGETPGGCTSKETCEAYCHDASHREECVAFGEKVGFIKPEEAAMIRKTGGVGPGGCNSSESCRAFCNDPTHREECFKFAQDNGLISKEEAKRTQDGFVQLRAGLEQAPPEVAECMKTTLGENIIGDIQSGNLVPGPEIGERVRACFEKFGHEEGPRATFRDVPTAVRNCLQEKIGANELAEINAGAASPTPEMADAMRVCAQSVQFEQGFSGGSGGGQQGYPGPGGGQFGGETCKEVVEAEPYAGIAPEGGKCGDRWELATDSNGKAYCAITQNGCDQERPGTVLTTDQTGHRVCGRKVKKCSQGGPGSSGGNQGPGGFGGPSSIESFRNFVNTAPPEVASCIKEQLGGDIAAFQSGENIQIDPSKMRVCFEQFHPQMPQQGFVPSGPGGSGSEGGTMPPQGFPGQPGIPPQGFGGGIEECVRQMMSAGATDKDTAMRTCIEKMQGAGGQGVPPVGQYPPSTGVQQQFPSQPPPSYADCARRLFGDEGALRVQSGQITADEKLKLSQCISGISGSTGGQYPSNTQYPPPPDGQYPTNTQYPNQYPTGTTCPSGQYWDGKSCIGSTMDPVAECGKYGGTWTGTMCQMPSGAYPPPTGIYPPPPDGGTYTAPPPDGGTYVAPPPTDGGTYTAPPPTYEPAPLPPPPQSSRRGGFLGAVGSFFAWLFN